MCSPVFPPLGTIFPVLVKKKLKFPLPSSSFLSLSEQYFMTTIAINIHSEIKAAVSQDAQQEKKHTKL